MGNGGIDEEHPLQLDNATDKHSPITPIVFPSEDYSEYGSYKKIAI